MKDEEGCRGGILCSMKDVGGGQGGILWDLLYLIKAKQYKKPEHIFPLKKELLRWD